MSAPRKSSAAARRFVFLRENEGDVMAQVRVGSTDPKLIKRVAALCDNPAWNEFYGVYNPFVRRCCSAYGLDFSLSDELRQRVWVELVRRMPAYQYDPSGSFRGWLRRLCHHRAIDLYRERQGFPIYSLKDDDLVDNRGMPARNILGEPYDNDVAVERLALLQEARKAQDEVKGKVKPVRWEVFWRVVIEGEPLGETATSLGLKYATAYAAARHVAELLRDEGRRRERVAHARSLSADGGIGR